ncbi:MAG: EAL domain-containing protein [Deltaproteobacteria bacterium]|nr:EAL domain-containing protein [Deltaproteobacteria bacterium]MDQ3296956.1 EAL domain-containing protein [Myxococcota bacterium]
MTGEITDDAAKPIVICVDDDRNNLQALGRVLRARCTVLLAESGLEALALVEANPDVSCVLADLRMPGLAGAELLARVAKTRPQCRRAVVTGFPESDDLIAAINAGHLHYVITKPWKLQDLLQLVDQLVHTFKLERDNQRLFSELQQANHQLREHETQLQTQLDARGLEISVKTEQLAQMGHQLDALTLRDGLTGLYTHRAFQERLREEVARALRYGQPMSILIADIDGFATVNYDLGYQIGDDILRRLAGVLQEDDTPIRTSDVVARYSGEEFVLLLPETGKSGALTKAARLRDAVAAAEMPGGRKMSISIGVACLPEDAADPEGLLTAAEAALRGAKRGGPGRVHFFSDDDRATAGTQRNQTRAFSRIREPEVDRFRPYQERMNEVTTILTRDRSLACLLVDLSRLHRVELDLGVAHHSEIYDHAAAVLDRLRGAVLDPSDLICRTGDGDGYFVILAPRDSKVRVDLEQLAATVEKAIEEALAPMVTEVLREQPRITVGSARVLGNSLLRPERLTARLVADAIAATRNLRERKAHRDRSTLQDIILGDGLASVYQPIVDLGTGDIFAYEALTRGPRGTALESPATLFAIADEVDLTVELDRACFRGALRSAKTLEPVHRLFVNLLPMSFYDQAFIEVEVGNLLAAAGLTPANIVFEITERLAIENFASFKRALGAYTAMGFGIAIDDVGTRHSNLETVMSLRPHFIKISDVLVRGIARSTVKREMLRSLRHIAETIDAVMIAEGIEHLEDVIALRDLGLRYGQGYYMARPAPPFVSLRDDVRAELRNIQSPSSPSQPPPPQDNDNDDEDDDDRVLAIPHSKSANRQAFGTGSQGAIPQGIPKNAFGRPDDEITSDFKLPPEAGADPRRPRASQPPAKTDGAPPQPWQPLSDDEGTGEALIESLRKPAENTPDGERGPGRPGLN